MVSGQCFSYLNFSLFKKQPLILCISSSISTNPTTTRRTNHLRKKLLKTLTKPYPTLIITSLEPPPRLLTPVQTNQVFIAQENSISVNVNDVINAEFGKHWVFKLGFFLAALFVFQTVCAVLVFGSDDFVRKDRKDSVFDGNPSERSSLLLSRESNVLLSGNEDLGMLDMDERVNEIRAMAREVRESEKLKSKDNERGDEMGLEVDRRLMKIQKKLESFVKMPSLRVGEKEESEEIDKIEPLMVKKKYKFKGYSGDLGDKPKGFTGIKDSRSNKKGTNVLDSLDQLGGDSSVSVVPSLEYKGIQTPEKKSGNTRMRNESGMGPTQEASLKNPVGNDNITSNVENELLKGKAGHWWHSLPYVVAVMMGRGHDGEGPSGLFTLQTSSYNNESELSRIVAFQDRGDATNFCYILESFFEDLGDFSANLVPLSVKEFKEEVKSHSKNLVVVKKGQLKLYAGQPFEEVEMALRSLVV